MPSASPPAARASLRLLMVEDCEDDALLIRQELKRAGYAVTARRVDSAAGLREALAEPWDLITCDWKMPGFGGEEALAIIAGTGLDTPVVLVSGEIGEELAVAAMRSGAHDFVSKHRLQGLAVAVERDLREAEERRARRRAEQALQAAQERFRALLESALDPIALVDATGTYLYANPVHEALCGFSPAELMGTNALDLVAPDDRARLLRELTEGTRTRRVSHTVEFRIRHRDGSCRIVEAIAHNRLDDPAVGGIVLNVRDITARRRMEETLRLHSAMVDHLPEGVMLARVADAVIVHANLRFEELFGYGPGELVGRHVSVLNANSGQTPATTAEAIVRWLRETGAWEGEVQNRRKDGTAFRTWAKVVSFAHPEHGAVWVTIQRPC